MKKDRGMMLVAVSFLIGISGIFPANTSAQEYIERRGFVFGVAGGYGLMNVNTNISSRRSQGSLALGFRGGYVINSRVIMGLELNGWTLHAYDFNDPSRGESVSNASVFINYFPFSNLPVYFAGGAGQTSYANNSPAVPGRENGGSWFVGSGYEHQVSKRLMLVPQIRYCQGNFTGGNFSVYEIALGVNWYSDNLNK